MTCPVCKNTDSEKIQNIVTIPMRDLKNLIDPPKYTTSIHYGTIDLLRCRVCGVVFS